MDRADIIKKNRNEWFDKACKYKTENDQLKAENDGLKKQARCPCGEELEGLGYGQDGSVIYECNKCKSQINISKEAWQARKENSNDR